MNEANTRLFTFKKFIWVVGFAQIKDFGITAQPIRINER